MKPTHVLLLLAAIPALISPKPKTKPAPPTEPLNLKLQKDMINIKPSQLASVIKTLPFAIVLFNRPNTAKGRENLKVLKQLQSTFKDHDLKFVQVLCRRDAPELNQVYAYIGQVQKHYTGLWSYEALQNWAYEVYFARPRQKASLADIDSIDSHYFVYVDDTYRQENETKIVQLAKLLNPLAIIYGLKKDELKSLLKRRKPKSPLWIYREYGDEVIPVDVDQPLQRLSDFVIRNEFPDFVHPTESALRLLLEFKVPTLLYYTSKPKEQFVEVLKELLKPHKEYLILTIVDTKKQDKATRFLTNFMDAHKSPAIRILNMSDKVKRYKFIGKAQPLLVSNFVHNYIAGNLEAYTVSEKIKRGETVNGVLKGNHKTFNRVVADMEVAHLVYVHGEAVTDSDKHFRELAKVQKVLKQNIYFDVIAINHDKNDLDEYYNDALPFVFLTNRKGGIEHYDGELEASALVKFVLQHYPYLHADEQLTDEL